MNFVYFLLVIGNKRDAGMGVLASSRLKRISSHSSPSQHLSYLSWLPCQMSAPKTRQLHPCVSIENRSAGTDFAVYLRLNGKQHLATGHSSVLKIYSIITDQQQQNYVLQLEHSIVLQGSLISLHVIPSTNVDDMLLLGFTTHCVSLVKVCTQNTATPLQAISILEFDVSMGDLQVETSTDETNGTTIAVISNAQLYLTRSIRDDHSVIGLTDPIVLPTGEYGSILSHSFFLASDTILLLHRSRNGVFVTAISDQDVILWSHAVSNDAQFITVSGSTLLVVAANSITQVQDQGILHVLPVNGFCEESLSLIQDALKLSIALDGSRWVWLPNPMSGSALVLLRRGGIFLYHTAGRLIDTGKCIPSSELSAAILLPNNLLFLGSRLSDGLLLNLEFEPTVFPACWRPPGINAVAHKFSAEERELYHIVSDSDEDPSEEVLARVPVLKSITLQDRLVSLAPIATSSAATVCAVGYGVSGGLGCLHTAGTHGILDQYDLAHVVYVGRIYSKTLILGFKDRGVHILDENGSEMPLQDKDLLSKAKILMAGGDGIVVLRNEISYTIVSLERNGTIRYQQELTHFSSNVVSVTNHLVGGLIGFLEENGTATLVNVAEWNETEAPTVVRLPEQSSDMEIDAWENDEEDEDEEMRVFYSNSKITAIDVFVAPRLLFEAETGKEVGTEKSSFDTEMNDAADLEYASEEQMLYAEVKLKTRRSEPEFLIKNNENPEGSLYCVLCRQNGCIEVYEYIGTGDLALRWKAQGIAFGLDLISGNISTSIKRRPRSQNLFAQEICFFRSSFTQDKGLSLPPKFFMAVETSAGDMLLYRWNSETFEAIKQPLDVATRQSKEQSRHRAKLVRKGAVAKGVKEDPFKHRKFHRFNGISGQTGLFVATFRPFWLLSDRGTVALVDHRSLHAAPAGGLHRPVVGFIAFEDGTFVVVHERVGRVGTQRLTLFGSILKPNCVYTGNLAVEKFPLGVTVRKIVTLPDEDPSDRPLYALLVSREAWVDQGELNSDGLTDEEREVLKAEKEAIRMKKQVEADLGGFDIESEWVEEIDREDCIQINTELGGAPPIHQPAYSLWIVDASNSFRVVDSYQLEEYEHGIDLKVMSLTDFTGVESKDDSEDTEENRAEVPFLVVGTGIVTRDGEDVAAKGRALLFRVQRTTAAHVAELSLVYEKTIFHGPVTTISCLTAEGNSRLVVGAGADVNVEQWGDERLTQVGFYRATMHILKIQHFKSFLLLSDAYDSVYFLVWRESDKSLTLLAKDYDPIAVYAAGVLVRGAALSLCVHDERENLQFFQYAPAEAAARGGNKLVCRADFHLGKSSR